LWASNFTIFFSKIIDFSFSNLTLKDDPCPFTLRNPTNRLTPNISFARLAPNVFEPPFTIATSITFLSLKGKGLMVDEPITISIVEVPNGFAITQPKEKKRLMGNIFGTNGIAIFQGLKSSVTIQLMQDNVQFVTSVQYIAHRTNLVVQNLNGLNLVKNIELGCFLHVQLFCSQP
jgi:hypothetical protein